MPRYSEGRAIGHEGPKGLGLHLALTFEILRYATSLRSGESIASRSIGSKTKFRGGCDPFAQRFRLAHSVS